MYDLISIGELLIDFFPGAPGAIEFSGKAGGAPCNVAAQAMLLGEKAAVICKLGADQFGYYLKNYAQELGLDTSYISFTHKANTTLAFVHLDETGNRSFSFYRKPGADQMLEPSDLPMEELAQAGAVAFGGVGLSAEPIRSTLFAALEQLRGQALIAYDPNLRPGLWLEGECVMREVTLKGMAYADVVKLADEELQFLLETQDLAEAAAKLLAAYPNIKLCFITGGAAGCYLLYEKELLHAPAYATGVVDTTGAGDAFFGALLHRLLKAGKGPEELGREELLDMMAYANAAGSLTCAGKGAISSMPDEGYIHDCLAHTPTMESVG